MLFLGFQTWLLLLHTHRAFCLLLLIKQDALILLLLLVHNHGGLRDISQQAWSLFTQSKRAYLFYGCLQRTVLGGTHKLVRFGNPFLEMIRHNQTSLFIYDIREPMIMLQMPYKFAKYCKIQYLFKCTFKRGLGPHYTNNMKHGD